MLEGLRAFLLGIGPGGVLAGLAILLGALALLVLSSAAIGFALANPGSEEAERDAERDAEREAGGKQYTVPAAPASPRIPP